MTKQLTMSNEKKTYLWEFTTEDLRAELELRGFYTNNLWHVDDVMNQMTCSFTEAQEVLDKTLTSDWIMGQVWETMSEVMVGHTHKTIDNE